MGLRVVSRRFADGRAIADWRGRSWAQMEITRLRRRFLRRGWPSLAAFPVVLLPAAVLIQVIENPALRSALVGVLIATCVWVPLMVVMLWSGTGSLTVGEQAEDWTADELRPLRGRGWRILANATLGRTGDIDLVAIGAAGVLVIETKWHRGVPRPRDLSAATRQARRHRNEVRGVLRSIVGSAPVTAVVVVWGPHPPVAQRADVDGTVVIAGRDLAGFVGGISGAYLSGPDVERAFERLRRQVEARDQYLRSQTAAAQPR